MQRIKTTTAAMALLLGCACGDSPSQPAPDTPAGARRDSATAPRPSTSRPLKGAPSMARLPDKTYVYPIVEKPDIASLPFYRIGEAGFDWLDIASPETGENKAGENKRGEEKTGLGKRDPEKHDSEKPGLEQSGQEKGGLKKRGLEMRGLEMRGELLAIDEVDVKQDPVFLTAQGRANILPDSPYHRPLWKVRFGDTTGWMASSQLAIDWPELSTQTPPASQMPLEYQLDTLRFSGLIVAPFLPRTTRHDCDIAKGTPVPNLMLSDNARQPWPGHGNATYVIGAAYRPGAGEGEMQRLVAVTDNSGNTLFCFSSKSGDPQYVGSFSTDFRPDSPLLLGVTFADGDGDGVVDWTVKLALIGGDDYAVLKVVIGGGAFLRGTLRLLSPAS